MKKNVLSASRLVTLALACVLTFSFAACSGDDDELSVDELLSEKTTPIDFEFDGFEYLDRYFLFDYAGSRFVGSDTITRSKCTLELRQGKHHLIWMKGQYGSDVDFIPESRTFSGHTTSIYAAYAEMDIEVTPYLMPVQKVKFQKRIQMEGSSLEVMVTDIGKTLQTPSGIKVSREIKVTGFPFMNNVSLDGNSYDIEYETYAEWGFFDIEENTVGTWLYTLCPTNRIEDIQLKVEVKDINGNRIPTTALPKIYLQRGCTTLLRGPLFSGDTSDWTVTVE